MKWEFWKWLLRGLKDKPGYLQLIDRWLIVHILVGIVVALVVDISLDKAAQTILLPLAGVFVGLSFAWVGNAQAILQENEIIALAKHHPDGVQTYVYTFQLAILIILITLILWGLAGLGIFNSCVFLGKSPKIIAEIILYFFSSLTLRECWHVVMGSQLLILSRIKIRNEDSRRNASGQARSPSR